MVFLSLPLSIQFSCPGLSEFLFSFPPGLISAASWLTRSFFRSDKLVGTALLKLERLENECEIREIVEVWE